MDHDHKPVTLGSPRFRTVDTGAFLVTEAWFPPGTVLESHTHNRSIFSVVLQGSIDTAIGCRRLHCGAAASWTEPVETRHANTVGSGGARIIVTQPDPMREELLRPFGPLLHSVNNIVHPTLAVSGRRVAGEIAQPDTLSPLVADAHILLMLAHAMRLYSARDSASRPPRWLTRARDMVHGGFRGRLDLTDIATEVDVTPWHLAREFRRFYHASIGEYARAQRVDWALEQLVSTAAPIGEIAQAAGYADQSHFTRACAGATGYAPAAYRRRALA